MHKSRIAYAWGELGLLGARQRCGIGGTNMSSTYESRINPRKHELKGNSHFAANCTRIGVDTGSSSYGRVGVDILASDCHGHCTNVMLWLPEWRIKSDPLSIPDERGY